MSEPRSAPFITIVFAVAYALAYVIAVWKNLALFTYHPLAGTLGFGVEKPHDGPAMYWFGWIATAAIAAIVACLIAAMVPQRYAARVASAWAWTVPLTVLMFFVWLLRGYFLR
ncbi:MAG: hypothetical protein JWN94_1188 [Betaproteobacteria bacterium]|nr:hypothetical protein [Betaproteobacteria bacterium]